MLNSLDGVAEPSSTKHSERFGAETLDDDSSEVFDDSVSDWFSDSLIIKHLLPVDLFDFTLKCK